MPPIENSAKGIFEHLDDLTRLLLQIGIVFAVSTVIVFIFTPKIFHLILGDALANLDIRLVTIRPAETLMTEIKLAAFGGLILGSPVTIPLIWSYIKPALTKKERRAITAALAPSIALFVLGFTFSYLVILPLAVRFLLGLALSFEITPFWTISSYLSLVISLGLSFGIAFELPVVIFILARLGIVTCADLKAFRKYVIVALLILAALITPPDAVSQVLLAVPLLILYETSILLVRVFCGK